MLFSALSVDHSNHFLIKMTACSRKFHCCPATCVSIRRKVFVICFNKESDDCGRWVGSLSVHCFDLRLSYNLNYSRFCSPVNKAIYQRPGGGRPVLLIYASSFPGSHASCYCCYYSSGGICLLASHPCRHSRSRSCSQHQTSTACYYRRSLSCRRHLD